MKRLKTFFTAVLASLFLLTATVGATPTNGWRVTISSPANTTSKSFKVQYTTLTIGAGDQITVELFQNSQSIGSQTTTADNGDSGAFDVTVADTGVYSYFIKASNTGDVGGPKATSAVNVTVSDQPQGETNVINTGSTDAASNNNNQGSANTGTGTNGATNGVNSATTNPAGSNTGQVGNNPATTDGQQNGNSVLGAQTQNNKKKANVGLILAVIAAVAGIGFGGYRYWLMRRDNAA